MLNSRSQHEWAILKLNRLGSLLNAPHAPVPAHSQLVLHFGGFFPGQQDQIIQMPQTTDGTPQNILQTSKAALCTRGLLSRVSFVVLSPCDLAILFPILAWDFWLCFPKARLVALPSCALPSDLALALHWLAALLVRRLKAKINAVGPRRGSII